MKLKYTKLLIGFVFVLVQWLVIQPLGVMALMTRLALIERKLGAVHAPQAWLFVSSPFLYASLIAVSTVCILLVVRGLRRMQEPKREWMASLAASVFLLLETVAYTVWIRRLDAFYAGLGVK